ncbi:hypothetical protein D7D52_31945 [Nocardia yunnanensis]|uniref:Uncharacterized protein n=1 Tax=Nocardia yunnanensis TaxID=2382165 RepID=A0A386ZM69_9NOCA|nr:hypothetical protein D7D52_31945 [Nocardia yunnanensis]
MLAHADGTVLVSVRRQNWAVFAIGATLVVLFAIGLAVLVSTVTFDDETPNPPAAVPNCQPFCEAPR